MVFQLAEDYVRPLWPPVTGQPRTMMHLDVQVDDLDAAVADAESLGAELAEIQPRRTCGSCSIRTATRSVSVARSTDGQ